MTKLHPPRVHTPVRIRTWWLSATLIAINVGLFLLQISQGMDANQPSTADAIRWGADYAPLTYSTERYRLFSSMFFHFGFIHLMMNMWALYVFGHIAEQMLGRVYFFGLYIFAGLGGSLLSGIITIWDSTQLLQNNILDPNLLPKVSAGASGAVMGIGAGLTLLSLFPVLTTQRFILDKKTLLMVMLINLSIGFVIPAINNAAHIGGMLMGMWCVIFWYFGEKWRMRILCQSIGIVSAFAICFSFYQYCMAQSAALEPLWAEVLQAMRHYFKF